VLNASAFFSIFCLVSACSHIVKVCGNSEQKPQVLLWLLYFYDNHGVCSSKYANSPRRLDIPLPTLFDYTVAEGIAVAIGQRVIAVRAQAAGRGVVMECVAATEMAPERIKPVMQVLHDSAPLLGGAAQLAALSATITISDRADGVVRVADAAAFRTNPSSVEYFCRIARVPAALRLISAFPGRKVVQRRILAKLAEQLCNLACNSKDLSATAGAQLKALRQRRVESFQCLLPSQAQGERVIVFKNTPSTMRTR
jgi:primosomal protein N'